MNCIKIITFALILLTVGKLEAVEPKIDAEMMRVTCYTWTGNRTASGVWPEEGMCASNWEHMGQIAVVYDSEMNLIGEFKVTDTGGARSLKNGTSIDIYRDDLKSCNEWVKQYGDYLYVEWKEGED